MSDRPVTHGGILAIMSTDRRSPVRPDPMARATVHSAELTSRGVLRAAQFSFVAAVLAAFIAGLCGVVGVVVQGHFALQQARIAATAGTTATTPHVAESPQEAREVSQARLDGILEPVVDVAKLTASCFCVSALLPGIAVSTAQRIVSTMRR